MLNESFFDKSEKKLYDVLPHTPETIATTLFIISMAVYYLWRMFAITPQYDELFTYYTFISRGPIYSAIHWPLPNNHVGYSVLSAFLDLFFDSFIGLRGVSFVCAIVNLILVYEICKKFYSHGLPFAAVVLFASMQVVNEYSVQGRGYTLATTCFLAAIYLITGICRLGETGRRSYILLVLFLFLGLYTVPSSVYWVIPVCLSAVLFLAINAFRINGLYPKLSDNIYFKKLRDFVLAGLVAALFTTFAYGIIWLAIGSNLLVKTEGSMYYGLTHGTVLLRAPVKALSTGINYMLDQPYIQSLSKDEFWGRFGGWILSILNYMVPNIGVLLLVFIIISLFCLFYECIKHFEYSRTVINLIVIVNLLFLGLILCFQHKLPYLRVFSYSGFISTLCVITVMERIINVSIRTYNGKIAAANGVEASAHSENEVVNNRGRWYGSLGVYIPMVTIVIYFVTRFLNPSFSSQLGDRENDLFNILYIANVENRRDVAALDCDQQYLMKFGWDIDCQKTDVTGAGCVILDKHMMEPGYSGENFWKFYQTFETIDWDYLGSMRIIYENDQFILYVK